MPVDDFAAILDPEGDLAYDEAPVDDLFAEEELSLREKRCQREPWRCPRKPKAQEIIEEAQRVKEDHAYRLAVNIVMQQFLNGERHGCFKGDEKLIADGELVPAALDMLKNDHFNACAWHARMDLHIKAQGRAVIEVEEREAKEDFDRLLIEEWADDFRRANNGEDIHWALPECFGRTGNLIAYIAVDPANTTTGLRFQMIDPNTFFAVSEGARGIRKAFVIYQATAEDVIGWYGDNGGKLERKVRKMVREESRDANYDPLCEKECIFYHDRDHAFVIWGGEELRYWQHGYGKVPFVLTASGVGMPSFMQTPDAPFTGNTDADILRMGSEFWQANSRQLDLARKNQPPLYRLLSGHAQNEAVLVRMMSAFKRQTWNPGLVVGQEPQSVQDGEPETAPGEGGITLVRNQDTVNPFPNYPTADVTNPLMAFQQMSAVSGFSSITTNGGNLGGAQASGNAIDMLSQQGADGWSPYTLGIQGFWEQALELAHEWIRDYGDSIGALDEDGDGVPGVLYVPRSRPSDSIYGLTDPHELTPEVFARTGIRVKAVLRKFNPMSLPPLVSAVMMAKQAGLMSQEIGIELIAAAQDIDDEMRRIEEDQLRTVPELMAARALRLGYQRSLRALMDGDVESAKQLLLETKYLADQLTVAQMTRMSMVSQATMEAFNSAGMASMSGATEFGQQVMSTNPALSGGQTPPEGNAAPYLSPSPLGGTTGQQSPGRPQTQQGQPTQQQQQSGRSY